MSSQPVQTRPLAVTLLPLILLAVAQLSCWSFPRLGFAPRFDFDFDLDLEEAMRELFPEEEMLFIKWCSETLEAEPAVQKVSRSPHVSRSAWFCFTYPAKRFPENMPDGVWAIEQTNRVPPTAQFLREPIGKESRAASERAVKHVAIVARQRSEKAKRLIGEISMLEETCRDKWGKIEYRVFSIRLVGAYEPQEKKWSLVSKSIGPAGAP
jgi:hypothetical protein